MARSDNVVRAGLTPKYIDSQTLIEMLTYETGPAKIYYGDELPTKVWHLDDPKETQLQAPHPPYRECTEGLLLSHSGVSQAMP